MQKDASPDANGGNNTTNSSHSSPLESYTSYLSPQPVNQVDTTNGTIMCPSFFLPKSPFPNSLNITPSSDNITSSNAISTETRLYQARLILEYQQLRDHYDLCLTHLHNVVKQSESLRQENAELQLVNRELMNRLSLLSQATIQNSFKQSRYMSLLNDFHRLGVGDGVHDSHAPEEITDFSPTSVIEHNQFEQKNGERITLPKSISVRSSGYLKMNQPGGNNEGPSCQRVASPLNGTQRVCVPGGKKEQEALELEVYNQGMLKTELCNKWQETGTCPYGENCQFAHGITELRAIIRHPRYKTEVCRMVLGGDTCPYGHRCHFRHALTDQERLLGRQL